MQFFARIVAGFVIGCAIACLGMVVPAHGSGLASEAWRVASVEKGGDAVCAPSRAALLRIGMPAARCARQIVDGERGQWIALFTCAGVGWGRTVFRETGAGSLRIETQGIVGGQPFAVDYEAQSVDTCAPAR